MNSNGDGLQPSLACRQCFLAPALGQPIITLNHKHLKSPSDIPVAVLFDRPLLVPSVQEPKGPPGRPSETSGLAQHCLPGLSGELYEIYGATRTVPPP